MRNWWEFTVVILFLYENQEGGSTIKKIIGSIILVLLCLTSFLIYNHNLEPTESDVFYTTKEWSPQTEEVYFVRKIDGAWLTIFRSQHSLMIGELYQNWWGSWELREKNGKKGLLASIYYPPPKNDEIIWGARESGNNEIAYYFGQIINPEIDSISIETKKNFYEDTMIIFSNGNRYFFKFVKGKIIYPVNIRGNSKSGEVIYSTLPKHLIDLESSQ